MKKIVSLSSFVLFAMIFLASCNSDKKAVKDTAETFLKAIIAGDFAKSQSLVTPETHEKWGDFLQIVADNLDQETKELIKTSQIKVSDIVVTGNDAEVICTEKIPYFAQESTVLHLKKVDGKWLINEPNAIVLDRVKLDEDLIGIDVDMSPDSIAKDLKKDSLSLLQN